MAAPSQVPQRLPAGATSDPPYGPLADSGMSNPFFYHEFSDDFDYSLGATGLYTVSKGSTGTAVHTAGDGGLITLTTAATLSDYVSIQLPAASFTLPYSAGAATGKKLFFLTRLQLSDATNSAFIVGLADTTATIFTALTDGVYFSKASGSTTNLNIVTNVGSTAVVTAVPTSAYTLANATFLDMGFYIDRYGNLNVFVGFPLVGWLPQSGSGTGPNYAAGVPTAGRVLQIATPTLTTANLNLTMGVQAGAAAAKALTADFWLAQKER